MQNGSLSAFMQRNGRRFEILRNGDLIGVVRGLKDQRRGRDYLGFPPGTDVRDGDRLREVASGEELLVEATSNFESFNGFTNFIAFYQSLDRPEHVTTFII